MDEPKKKQSIPSWQQAAGAHEGLEKAAESLAKAVDLSADLVDVARQFLQDAAIKDAPREEKLEFLREKGLAEDVIAKLITEDDERTSELKTVHDTSTLKSSDSQLPSVSPTESAPISEPASLPTSQTAPIQSRSEMPPIITYPEFLLKPQKPPPLITVPRLINAAYALAAVSTITWGASKFLIEPMLKTLTEARHDLADGTLQDLETFNEKLEGLVSHVPYIASSTMKRPQDQDEDTASIDSDPTELFHRDIATQTSPGLSRSSSTTSLTRKTLDPTIAQAQRLAGLGYSLRSLAQSVEHANDNNKHLANTVEDFQKKLDNMESSFGALRNDYYGSSGTYASAAGDLKKAAGKDKDNEAQKFKQEIRSLKGVLLSSRNFPTATRPVGQVVSGGYGQR